MVIRGGPRDGETRVVPDGMRELRFAVLPNVLGLLDEVGSLDELHYDTVSLSIDPIQAALGVPLQWPQEEE